MAAAGAAEDMAVCPAADTEADMASSPCPKAMEAAEGGSAVDPAADMEVLL